MVEGSAKQETLVLDDVMELIPWYVNGTLSDAEAKEIEAFAEQYPDVQAEIDHQSELAAGLCLLEDAEADGVRQAQSWQTLSAQIAQENQARAPAQRSMSWLPAFRSVPALAATVAAFAFVAVFFVGQETTEFRTLTSGDDNQGPVIVFQLSPEADPEDLETILDKHGLTLIEGPTENGVYRADISTDALAGDLATTLMAAPEIVFAAPEGSE